MEFSIKSRSIGSSFDYCYTVMTLITCSKVSLTIELDDPYFQICDGISIVRYCFRESTLHARLLMTKESTSLLCSFKVPSCDRAIYSNCQLGKIMQIFNMFIKLWILDLCSYDKSFDIKFNKGEVIQISCSHQTGPRST